MTEQTNPNNPAPSLQQCFKELSDLINEWNNKIKDTYSSDPVAGGQKLAPPAAQPAPPAMHGRLCDAVRSAVSCGSRGESEKISVSGDQTALAAERARREAGRQKHKMEKLLASLEQVSLAIKHLTKFEKMFTFEFQKCTDDINQLLDVIESSSITHDQLLDIVVEKRLQEVNKQVRKLKHQIALPKSLPRIAAHLDERSPEIESNSAKNLEKLLDLQTSQRFQWRQIYIFVKKIYDELEENEKKCLLCFAVFTENEHVKRRMLSYWWKAEGYLQRQDDNRSIKEVADGVLQKLVEKGVVEPIYKKRWKEVKRYRMKAVYWSAVVKLAEEDFFVFDILGNLAAKYTGGSNKNMGSGEGSGEGNMGSSEGSDKANMGSGEGSWKGNKGSGEGSGKGNMGSGEWSGEKNGDGERLVHQNWLKKWENVGKIETIFNAKENFPDHTLKTLAKKKGYTATEWLLKMKSLKVLYLGSWRTSTRKHRIELDNKINILEGLKNMNSLKLLSLQGISGITSLPKSISGLTHLEILDLKSCHNLEEIPQEIEFLKNLTHLDISNCFCIDHMPKELSSLTNLKVLKGLVLHGQIDKSCTLEDLSSMTSLNKLSIVVGDEEFPRKTDSSALQCLTKLRILSVFWGEDSTRKHSSGKAKIKYKELLKSFPILAGMRNGRDDNSKDNQLPESLEKLDLLCYPKATSPPWLSPSRLKNLERLYIRGGKFKGDLEKEKWDSVRSLRLKYLAGIKISWEEMRSAFPGLTYLEKVDCPMITLCPCDEDGVWVSEHDKKPYNGSNGVEKLNESDYE